MINEYNKLEKEKVDLNSQLSLQRKKVYDEFEKSKEKIKNIKALYFEILKHGILADEKASGVDFNITPKLKYNPVEIQVKVPKTSIKGLDDSLGRKRFKLLAYDLTVFFNIIKNNRKLPHFLIHDGVYHSVSLTTIVNILNYINKQKYGYKFQYIITANENELCIPKTPKHQYGEFNFNIMDKIIALYDNIPEKMFFKRDF